MADPFAPKDLVSLDELATSTMWETSALVELLERKAILTKQEVLAMIQELRQREPTAIPPRGVSSSYIAVPPLPASLSQGRSSPVVYFLCPVEEMCVSCPPVVKPRRSVSLLTPDGGSSGVTSFPAPSASMPPCALDKRPQGRRQDSPSLDVRL